MQRHRGPVETLGEPAQLVGSRHQHRLITPHGQMRQTRTNRAHRRQIAAREMHASGNRADDHRQQYEWQKIPNLLGARQKSLLAAEADNRPGNRGDPLVGELHRLNDSVPLDPAILPRDRVQRARPLGRKGDVVGEDVSSIRGERTDVVENPGIGIHDGECDLRGQIVDPLPEPVGGQLEIGEAADSSSIHRLHQEGRRKLSVKCDRQQYRLARFERYQLPRARTQRRLAASQHPVAIDNHDRLEGAGVGDLAFERGAAETMVLTLTAGDVGYDGAETRLDDFGIKVADAGELAFDIACGRGIRVVRENDREQ